WDAANKDRDLSQAVEELQFTILLGNLTQNNISLVEKLQLMRRDGEIKVAQDLVNVDWNKIISSGVTNGTILIPSSVEGSSQAEKMQNHISHIIDKVDSTYPCAAFSRALSNDIGGKADEVFGPQIARDLSSFFKTCPDFDLLTSDIRGYLSD